MLPMMKLLLAPLSSLLLILLLNHPQLHYAETETVNLIKALVEEGDELVSQNYYREASVKYLEAMIHSSDEDSYTPFSSEELVVRLQKVHATALGGREGAFLEIAKIYIKQGDHDTALHLINTILEPPFEVHPEAQSLLKVLQNIKETEEEEYSRLLKNGYSYVEKARWSWCSQALTRACEIGRPRGIFQACTTAFYCKNNILDWGDHYGEDVQFIEAVTRFEVDNFRNSSSSLVFDKAVSVHPHMALGYLIPPEIQKFISASYATTVNKNKKLSSDIPFNHELKREKYEAEALQPGFKIKLGFVGYCFNSQAVLFLAHKMFDFFDKDKFEIHIFSLNEEDPKEWIRDFMDGADWRQRVKNNVHKFHDVRDLANDENKLARYIEQQSVHCLIDWDGYSRQFIESSVDGFAFRSKSAMSLKPAPIQLLHQEFLATTGAPYVDYVFTDERVSPLENEALYTEKFIYMPNHFFSKGHALQNEITPPSIDYLPFTGSTKSSHVIGTGSPQENKCLSGDSIEQDISFVYCNSHKFLKYNPETLKSWLDILQNVPGSILCLLQNPSEGVPYLRDFVNRFDSSLNDRIFFLEWERNPFKNQRRQVDFCNAVLDTFPYNGHTTAMDSLYAGVPMVTRSDGDYMASRVTTSANEVLGIPEMNGNGVEEYVQIATQLATDSEFYSSTRSKIIESALMKNPMHPFWDVERYVKDFETGLQMAWERFLSNKSPVHIRVSDRTFIEKQQALTFDEL